MGDDVESVLCAAGDVEQGKFVDRALPNAGQATPTLRFSLRINIIALIYVALPATRELSPSFMLASTSYCHIVHRQKRCCVLYSHRIINFMAWTGANVGRYQALLGYGMWLRLHLNNQMNRRYEVSSSFPQPML